MSYASTGYKWNQLGQLNESFYEKYSGYTLEELRSLFRETEQKWQNWIDSLSEEELFVQGIRQWTGAQARMGYGEVDPD